MKRLLLPLLPLLLAACASAPERKEVALAAAEPGTLCEKEASTGTSLPKTRCRTAAQRKAELEGVQQTEDARRLIQSGPTSK